MSTESHWTFNRGRGGSTRSDGVSFSPALKWDGDIDDPPIQVVGEGAEWCWEVRFPGKMKYRTISPSKEGVYTPREVEAWIDLNYPLVDIGFVSGEVETESITVHWDADLLDPAPASYLWEAQLMFDWGYDSNQLLLEFPEEGDK